MKHATKQPKRSESEIEEEAEEKRLASLPARKLSISITGRAGEMLDEYCREAERTPSWVCNKLIVSAIDFLTPGEFVP